MNLDLYLLNQTLKLLHLFWSYRAARPKLLDQALELHRQILGYRATMRQLPTRILAACSASSVPAVLASGAAAASSASARLTAERIVRLLLTTGHTVLPEAEVTEGQASYLVAARPYAGSGPCAS